ncbi:MAG: hypothetical protein LC722_00535 [Actinobacteria bacterium]|nr:hypothetical protein [Actinomycetota bacterium]
MPRRVRVRGPWVREGSTIGPLGPFRGRLGIHWVIASVVVGVGLLVAGILALGKLGLL